MIPGQQPTAFPIIFRTFRDNDVNPVVVLALNGGDLQPIPGGGFRYTNAAAKTTGGIELFSLFPHGNGNFWLIKLIAHSNALLLVKDDPEPLHLQVVLQVLDETHCAQNELGPHAERMENGFHEPGISQSRCR